MFDDLIRSGCQVRIFTGKENHCITCVIVSYNASRQWIRIDAQGMMMPIASIAKIELVAHSHAEQPPNRLATVQTIHPRAQECSLFRNFPLLDQDVDFDNAMYLGLSVSIWEDIDQVGYGTIQYSDATSVYMNDTHFDKREYRFLLAK